LVRKGFSVPQIIPPSFILTTQAESWLRLGLT